MLVHYLHCSCSCWPHGYQVPSSSQRLDIHVSAVWDAAASKCLFIFSMVSSSPSRKRIYPRISMLAGQYVPVPLTISSAVLAPNKTDSERLALTAFLTRSSHTPSQFHSPGRRFLPSADGSTACVEGESGLGDDGPDCWACRTGPR